MLALKLSAKRYGILVDKFNEGNPVMMIAVGVVLSLATAVSNAWQRQWLKQDGQLLLTLTNNLQTTSWWQLNMTVA
jgi:F0F1-type ATP synthase assembly protein I